MTDQAMNFKTAFETLRANAEHLRTNQDIDIDALVPLVEESSKAFGVVQERINAAREALAAHLPASSDAQPSA